MTDVDTAIDAATQWRIKHPEHMATGVVLVFGGQAYGWKNELRDPNHERPGALAIDADGYVWEACGGNDQDGAREWDEIERPVNDRPSSPPKSSF